MRNTGFFIAAGVLCATSLFAQLAPLRPPAVPLVTHDPYFSIWSAADVAADERTQHWTGKAHPLVALVRVDGKLFRILGHPWYDGTPELPQKKVEVLPTRTIYVFEGEGVRIGLAFVTPALPEDLDVLARPITYVDWTAAAIDGKEHAVQVHFEAGSDIVINTVDQNVAWARLMLDGQPVLRVGSREQKILGKRGDDLRIDWGYLYLMADRSQNMTAQIAHTNLVRTAFAKTGRLEDSDDFSDTVPTRRGAFEALAIAFDLGKVTAKPVSRFLMIGYDDLYSIEYFERRQRPYWRRNSKTQMNDLLRAAQKEHDALVARSIAFDNELMADLRNAGGEKYARLAALAYRQTLAAHKLTVDMNGTPMFFPKENLSNGCISTVDVIYPSVPFTLLFNSKLLRAQLQPVLEYSAMPRWPWPFAPHDIGTYPLADGQVYGGAETSTATQMPIEETGNMLIMLAALAQVEGSAEYAQKFWPLLTKWAEYLREKGLDPEDQLSSDDFAGHLAHNSNLSIKAILGLGAYGRLCEATGRKDDAAQYLKAAREFAARWTKLADDGDHFRLAFDKPGTWSMKYNLVWDKLLGLHLFSPEVARKEMKFYRTKINAYGLPLDVRKDYTKLDWTLWTATLADNQEDFEALVAPAYRWAHETPNRVPLTDWYDTVTAKQQSGCQARSVVGGLFVKMLADPAMWRKYASRAMAFAGK